MTKTNPTLSAQMHAYETERASDLAKNDKRTIEKIFKTADADHNGELTEAEYSTYSHQASFKKLVGKNENYSHAAGFYSHIFFVKPDTKTLYASSTQEKQHYQQRDEIKKYQSDLSDLAKQHNYPDSFFSDRKANQLARKIVLLTATVECRMLPKDQSLQADIVQVLNQTYAAQHGNDQTLTGPKKNPSLLQSLSQLKGNEAAIRWITPHFKEAELTAVLIAPPQAQRELIAKLTLPSSGAIVANDTKDLDELALTALRAMNSDTGKSAIHPENRDLLIEKFMELGATEALPDLYARFKNELETQG